MGRRAEGRAYNRRGRTQGSHPTIRLVGANLVFAFLLLCVLACLLFSVFAVPALAALPPSASQIIQREGRLVFTDGSSFYDFEKNGTFHSGPMGMSGRTIEGHWKQQFSSFVIQGTWGWVNGFSAINDQRQLTLAIYPQAVESKKRKSEGMIWMPSSGPVKIYRCYFVVEELVKLPKPNKESSHA